MKIINFIFILLFLIAAALQYNDPDPYIWIPIYLYGAMLCYLAIYRKFKLIYYIAGFIVYGIYATYLLLKKDGVISWIKYHNAENIGQRMHVTVPWIETTREFFGLLILISVMIANLIWLTKSKGRAKMIRESNTVLK